MHNDALPPPGTCGQKRAPIPCPASSRVMLPPPASTDGTCIWAGCPAFCAANPHSSGCGQAALPPHDRCAFRESCRPPGANPFSPGCASSNGDAAPCWPDGQTCGPAPCPAAIPATDPPPGSSPAAFSSPCRRPTGVAFCKLVRGSSRGWRAVPGLISWRTNVSNDHAAPVPCERAVAHVQPLVFRAIGAGPARQATCDAAFPSLRGRSICRATHPPPLSTETAASNEAPLPGRFSAVEVDEDQV